MEGPSFFSYPATMRRWKKEALKSMRKELGGVNMDVAMIKQLEKSDVPSPDNVGFLSEMRQLVNIWVGKRIIVHVVYFSLVQQHSLGV